MDYGENFKAGYIPNYLLELATWPDFPFFKSRAENGCELYNLVRKTLQSFEMDPMTFSYASSFVSIRFLWYWDHLTSIAVTLNRGIHVTLTPDEH